MKVTACISCSTASSRWRSTATTVAELGPGSVLGERALVEGGKRTATLRAVTPAKVVVASADDIEPSALEELAAGHRREER